jgi:hypothetical protein
MKKLLLLFCLFLCVGTISAQKSKVKTGYRNALIFAYDRSNSVFEDENIKLEIYNEQLWVTNKTKKTLFIDMAQCFLNHNGSSRPIYSKDQDERSASKMGTSTSDDAYLTIAPSTGSKQNATFICRMSLGVYGDYSTTETPWGDFTDYDKRLCELLNEMLAESQQADPKRKSYVGTVSRHLLEDESVNNIGASIAYAFNKKAEEWTSVSLSTWVSDVILAPYYVTIPKDLKKKEMKGFGVKETKPLVITVRASNPYDEEFPQEKSPLVMCDWTGNFKKGTFALAFIGVKKAQKTDLLLNLMTYGQAALLAKLEADYHKSVVFFDGAETDWGKMTYSPTMESTYQKK